MRALSLSVLTIILSTGIAFAEPTYLEKRFSQLDTDRNGKITYSEVQEKPAIIRLMHLYYSGAFYMADFNKDGVLDRAEFDAFEEPLPVE